VDIREVNVGSVPSIAGNGCHFLSEDNPCFQRLRQFFLTCFKRVSVGPYAL
jgi:hypothetical protein